MLLNNMGYMSVKPQEWHHLNMLINMYVLLNSKLFVNFAVYKIEKALVNASESL